MKRTGIVILFLFYVTSFDICNGKVPEHVFEFGVDYGSQIYNYDGVISYLQPVTRHRIPVPVPFVVTYVKVTVKSWPKPKVTFSPKTHYVTIAFDRSQISAANYSIVVKAIMV